MPVCDCLPDGEDAITDEEDLEVEDFRDYDEEEIYLN